MKKLLMALAAIALIIALAASKPHQDITRLVKEARELQATEEPTKQQIDKVKGKFERIPRKTKDYNLTLEAIEHIISEAEKELKK